MKDLKCGLKNCVHNQGYSCCSKKIGIDEHTDCLSYEASSQSESLLFEAGTDIGKTNYSVDTAVECNAKCLYNKNNRCCANGITVMNDSNNGATCLTFIRS